MKYRLSVPLKSNVFSSGNRPRLWAMAALLAVSLTAALGDRLRTVSSVIDVDDTLRRVQIEDLLADNHWYDRTLPIVTAQAPYESPWSRLVDAPYVLITRLLEMFLPAERALDVACLIWPPMMLVPLVWLLHGAVTALLKRTIRPVELVCMLIFLMLAAVEFAPGRIDHHNVQLVLLAAFIRGLTIRDPRISGITAAAAAIVSLSVGLETVPMVVAGLAGVAVLGSVGEPAARRRMAAAGATLAPLAPVTALVLTGPAEILQVHCDAISAPWIAAVVGAGLILAAAPLCWGRETSTSVAQKAFRLATLGVPGAALLAGLAVAFPVCTGGPLHMIDPVTKAFWLDNVPQEVSGLTLVREPATRALGAVLALAIGAAVLAGAAVLSRLRVHEDDAFLTWMVVLAGLAMTLLFARYVRFAFLLAAIIAPLAISILTAPRAIRGPTRLWKAAAPASLAAFLMIGFSPFAGPRFEVAQSYLHFRYEDCAGEDFGALASLEPGVIMAPFGIHYPIAASGSGHTLSTISFHRSALGIRRLALAFTSTDPAVRRAALEGVDYVVVCAPESPVPLDDMPLLRDLATGRPPPGFIPAAENPSRLKIYHVIPKGW